VAVTAIGRRGHAAYERHPAVLRELVSSPTNHNAVEPAKAVARRALVQIARLIGVH
jgi:hypothetical protein